MKKVKSFLLVSLMLFLATGCDGVYNVEIYNSTYKEDATITENNVNNWYDKDSNGTTFKDLLDQELKRDNYYYTKTLISDSKTLGLNYKGDFNFASYSTGSLGYQCYEYFRVIDDGNNITIITSNKNLCFDRYKWLNNITVNVKTNHKVIDNNADVVNGYTYTWNVNRYNSANKVLKIILSKNNYVFNYNNEIVKNYALAFGIIASIVVATTVAILLFKAKGKQANKI